MTDTPEKTEKQTDGAPYPMVPELPDRVLGTYARLWQLETWLRRLIYVELRASAGDAWREKIRDPEGSWKADKRLTHMPTVEQNPLSYVQFSELQRVISDNWSLFDSFLLPKSIWEAKLEEISQIRHRVAHFRRGHADDLQRVVQLLRDLDQGFWRFCTSYNDPQPILPQSDDPVESHFLHLDPFPWGEMSDGKWARTGSADPEAGFGLTVEVLCRPWTRWSIPVAGQPGYLYDVTIHARQQRHLDYRQLIESTSGLHGHLVHVCLDSLAKSVRVTIPAVLGGERVIAIVERLCEACLYCLTSGLLQPDADRVQRLADSLPECVLGPNNPLTFLAPDMPCSFFGA
jgi:hypothetical protein